MSDLKPKVILSKKNNLQKYRFCEPNSPTLPYMMKKLADCLDGDIPNIIINILLVYFILFHLVINIYLFPAYPSLTHLLIYPLLLLLSVSASLFLLRDVITLYIHSSNGKSTLLSLMAKTFGEHLAIDIKIAVLTKKSNDTDKP
jgi:hypothetical protein